MERIKSNTVTAVIPCRNEFSTIKSVVRDVSSYVDEIIVVDNSLDRIIDLLKNEEVRLIFTDKKGKGYALRMGIRQAIGDIILFFDSVLDYYANNFLLFNKRCRL